MDRDREPIGRREVDGKRPGRGSKSPGMELAGIGLQFGLTIVVFVFVGVWLDRRLGTSPWLMIGCTFAGAGGGIYSMYRRAMALERDRQDDGQ